MYRTALTAMIGLSLAGCAAVREKGEAFAANKPDIDAKDVVRYTTDQDVIWTQFVTLSQSDPASDRFYNDVVDAGLLYVDARCTRYLDALAWFARARDAASRQIGYVSAAATAALAIENASKELLGLTPLGFTLLSSTIDNIGKGLLFELPPSAVKILVDEQRSAFRARVAKTPYTNRAAALATVQGYVAICLPVSIEAQVAEAVQNARFVAKQDDPPPPGAEEDEGFRDSEGAREPLPNTVPALEQAVPR